MVQFDMDDLFSPTTDSLLDFDYDQIDSDYSSGVSPSSSNSLDFEDDLFRELSDLPDLDSSDQICDPDSFLNLDRKSTPAETETITVKEEHSEITSLKSGRSSISHLITQIMNIV